MQSGDLSNAPTYRYWVTAEVCFHKDESEDAEKRGWFSNVFRKKVLLTPDMRVLSHLWRWSTRLGVRLELVFYGELAEDAVPMWDLLEKSAANPFSDWHAMESPKAVQKMLPFRPDLQGVIDLPERSAMYGGRGRRMEDLGY